MIREEDIVKAGRIQKINASRDDKAFATISLPPMNVDDPASLPLIVEIDGIFVPFFADSIDYVNSKGDYDIFEATFSHLAARDIDEMAGKDVWLDRDVFDSLVDDAEGLGDDNIMGYMVVANGAEVGKVADINDSTANVLLIVENTEGGEILIPVADEFFDDIDHDRHIITMTLPEGLLNIND
ncbi:MAG: hypothetical protein J6Y87_04840 [Muribaculaceae bacterium]|nr:hypothetical protein [Muribaculaceae bacterium]